MKKTRGLLAIRFFAFLIAAVMLLSGIPVGAVGDVPVGTENPTQGSVTEATTVPTTPVEDSTGSTEETTAQPDATTAGTEASTEAPEGSDSTEAIGSPSTEAATEQPTEPAAPKPDAKKEVEKEDISTDATVDYEYDDAVIVSSKNVFRGLKKVFLTFDNVTEVESIRVLVGKLTDTVTTDFDVPTASWTPATDYVSKKTEEGTKPETFKVTLTVNAEKAKSDFVDSTNGTDGFKLWITTGEQNDDNKLIVKEREFYIDETGPEISLGDDFDTENWYMDEAAFTVNAEDNSGVDSDYVSVNTGAIVNSGSDSYTLTLQQSPAEKTCTVTAYDTVGNKSTLDITQALKIDHAAPELSLDTNSTTWSAQQTFIVKATDGGESGVDVNSFCLDGEPVTATSQGDDLYAVSIESSGTLTVCDKAGHTSAGIALTMNVDNTKPKSDDVTVKFYTLGEKTQEVLGLIEKMLNVHLTTLYANTDDVIMRVQVSRNGGSPLVEIKAYNNTAAFEPYVDQVQTTTDGLDYVDFKIPTSSASTNYNYINFKLKDEAGNESLPQMYLSDVAAVYAEEDLISGGLEYVINTKGAPEVTFEAEKSSSIYSDVDTGALYAKQNAVLSFRAQDAHAKVYRLKVFFDTADKFDQENKPTADATVITGGIPSLKNGAFAVDATSGLAQVKDTFEPEEVSFSYSVTEKLTGKYILYIQAQNTGRNIGVLSKEIYFDNDAPDITDCKFDSAWSNAAIPLEFKVAEKPDDNAVGIDKVTVNGAEVTEKDGKYTYEMTERKAYVIKATDKLGNENTKTIGETDVSYDIAPPTIGQVTYNSNQTKDDVDVSVNVSDNLSGVKQVYAQSTDTENPIKVSVDALSAGQKSFQMTLSAEGEKTYKIYAVDYAGNTTPASSAKTITTKIDKSPIKIEKVSFDNIVTEHDKGVYSNKAVIMSVKMKQTGVATLDSAKLGDYAVSKPDALTARFTLPLETKIENILNNEFTFKNTAGTEATMSLKDLLLGDEDIDVNSSVKKNKELFEIIATNTKSSISEVGYQFTQSSFVGSDLYTDGTAGKLEFTITDALSGIDLNTVNVKFGKTGDLKDVTSALTRVSPEKDDYDKVTGATYSYQPGNQLETGAYTLTVDVKNNAGNAADRRSFSFYVDHSAPDITGISYDKKWTNQSIKLEFSVADLPAKNAIGFDTVTVNGEEPELIKGKFTYMMTERKDYVITATDKFGNSKTVTVNASDIPFDNTAPQVKSAVYNDQLTNADIEVTVTTADDLSGIKQVYAQNTANTADKITVDAAQEGQTVFNLTIKADGKNDYKIYAVDNAGNVTADENAKSITTFVDKSEIKISRVSFDGIVTGKAKGVYSNQNILISLTIDKTGLADLDTAAFGQYAVQYAADKLTATFTLPVGANGTKIENILEGSFTLKNTAGSELTEKLKNLLTENCEIVVSDSVKGDKNLFEIIATNAASTISDVTPTFAQYGDESHPNYFDGANGKLEFTITDNLSGIDMDTVKVQFGLNGSESDITSALNTDSTTDKYGKVTETKFTYNIPAQLETGYYTVKVDETNNAGNAAAQKTYSFYVDHTAPEIKNVTFDNSKWTNEKITVSYTVTEQPEINFIGVNEIKVVGDTTDKDYSPKAEDINSATKVYTFDVAYNEKFTITAKDAFGNEAISYTSEVLEYDEDRPLIGDFLYGEEKKKDIKDVNWATAENGIKVTFDIHDRSTKTWDKTEHKLSDLDTESVTVTLNGVETTPEGAVTDLDYTYDEGTQTYTYHFIAHVYGQYTVAFKDIATNNNSSTTSTIKIDKDNPEITGVKFEKAESVGDKILRLLSFGLYSNDDMKMTVDVRDIAPSSGIKEITASVNGTPLEPDGNYADPEKDPDKATNEVTEKAVFKINKDTLSDDQRIVFTVTDNAGNTITKTLKQVREGDLAYALTQKITKENLYDIFDIINTDAIPVIQSTIDMNREDESTVNGGVYTDPDPDSGKRWFSAEHHPHFTATYNISEGNAHLFKADLTLNGTNVVDTDDVSSDEIDSNEDNLEGNPTTAAKQDGSVKYLRKVDTDTITFTPDLGTNENLNRTSQDIGKANGGENTIKMTVEANSGNKKDNTEVFYVDDTAPVITEVKFAGDGRADAPQMIDENGNIVSKIVAERAPELSISDLKNYGYYFKDSTTISVTATDFLTPNGDKVNGCDVRDIHVIRMPLGDVTAQSGNRNDEVITAVTNNGNGSYTAVYTVEANYKGKLFFYATDRVDNRSNNYYPDGTIVESLAKHNQTSSSGIAVNTTPVAKDNNNVDLFNGNVNLTLAVSDTYSGIHTIKYTITSRWREGVDLGSESITIGQTDTSVPGWTIESREANSNLITALSKNITLDGSGIHNLNDIVIHLEATDRAGYPINCDDVTVSIDTTAPQIVLTPRDAVHNYYAPDSKDYYQDTRVFDITVTERNFNPDDFARMANIIAREGEKPVIVPGNNWTSYSDYTDSSTHTATLSFATDGDYTVELSYNDEAGNSATPVKSDDFVIDKIDPVITVTFDPGSGYNGSNYYSSTRTATVTIHEHNFAEGADYIVYELDAYAGDNTSRKSEPQLQTSGWSKNGDDHSATITFDEDGHYDFGIKYADKAKRNAQSYEADDFYIDLKSTNGKIEFTAGYNGHAFGEQTVAPGIVFTDNNIDHTATTYSLIRVSYDPENRMSGEVEMNDLSADINESSPTTKTVNYNDFPREERVDGIYVLNAHLQDKAGNMFDEHITFSVNRFGPTFMAGDSNTNNLVNSGYTRQMRDIKVTEINVEEIKNHDVSFTHDTEKVSLKPNNGYTVTSTGSSSTWYKYDFNVSKDNFVEEGSYTLTFASDLEYSDKQYNTTITNRTAKTDHGTYPVSFIYDSTAPDISIEGVSNGSVHSEAEKNIKIICLDNNLDKDSLKIVLKTDVANVLKEGVDYTVDDSLVGELDVDLPIKSGLDETHYDLQVEIKDLASNTGEEETKNFTLSATFFTMFFHNTLAVVLTSVGLAALIGLAIFLIIKKRKKEA